MTKEECIEQAVKYKHSGYNCAQAVIKSLSEYYGRSSDELLKMTTGFAAGMGTMEGPCGALVGANMMLGIQTNGSNTLPKSRRLITEFQKECGSTVCKELKGVTTGQVLCSCDNCVKNAVEETIALLL